MRTFFTTTLLILVSNALSAQNNTYLGAEAGMAYDLYSFTDPGDRIESGSLRTGLWGITISQEIGDRLSLESGLIRKYYIHGFGFRINSSVNGFSSNTLDAWQIPLRLNAQYNLYKEKIFLATTIGYHFCINSDYGAHSGGGGLIYRPGGDSVAYEYVLQKSPARTFSLLETGAGIEFRLFGKAFLDIRASYFTGLRELTELTLDYRFNNDPEVTASAVSKGDYWSVSAGLRYPASDIWKKKKAEAD